MSASLGAGISMGFAEALSDDGNLTGRGHPCVRGLICAAMTTVGGIWPHPPISYQRFSVGPGDCGCRRPCRTRGHLGAAQVHGYANVLRSSAGGTWWSTRVHYGRTHWKIVSTAQGAEPVGPAGNSKLGSLIGTAVGRKRGRIRISRVSLRRPKKNEITAAL